MEKAVVVVTKQNRFPYEYVAFVSGKERETLASDDLKYKAAFMAVEKAGLIQVFDIEMLFEEMRKQKEAEQSAEEEANNETA